MSKILINNFPQSLIHYTACSVSDEFDKVEFTLGFDLERQIHDIKNSTLTSFFQSILIHDEILVSYSDYLKLIEFIGIEDTLKLLDAKIIKIIMLKSNICLMRKDNIRSSLDIISLQGDLMEKFEKEVSKRTDISSHQKSQFIQFTDNSKIIIEDRDSIDLVYKEIISDIKANQTLNYINITSPSIDDMSFIDSLKVLRISNILQGLILQNHLKVDCITQDAHSKDYLNSKLGFLADQYSLNSLECFTTITEKKKIPDIYQIYKSKIMTMDEIIKCRETYNGSIFRKWLESKDYDQDELLVALLNSSTRDKGFIKFLRWVYPNLAGLVNVFSGAAAAAFDSYIVNKIIDGWKPSFFLDDILKGRIDRRIELHAASEKRDEIMKRFGKVGRNDTCPCQSGKKFKKCHGIV